MPYLHIPNYPGNMKSISMVRTAALLNLLGATGILIWWLLMPAFLPVADAPTHFEHLILDGDWIPVNMVGLVSTILLALGFPGFFFAHQGKSDKLGFAGLLVTSTGFMLFVSIQYYETLLWPAAAMNNPDLVQVNGALVSGNYGVASGLVASGIFLGLGYILFGISALRNNILPRLPLWMLIFGAPVFANGIVFPVRTVGLLFLVAGTIWLAIYIGTSSPPQAGTIADHDA
jgi:hypothetical protein